MRGMVRGAWLVLLISGTLACDERPRGADARVVRDGAPVDTARPDARDGSDDADADGAPADTFALPAPILIPAIHDFGDVVHGATAEAIFSLRNDGDATSGVIAVELRGDDRFVVVADACSGETLAPGASCSFAVTLTARRAGGASASLVAGDGVVDATASLRGIVLDGPLSISPTILDYGARAIGLPPATVVFTVTSSLGRPTDLRARIVGSGAAAFAITTDECTTAALDPGERCFLAVAYVPTVDGAIDEAELVVDGGDVAVAALRGTGFLDTSTSLLPDPCDFGDVPILTTRVCVLTLGTSGTTPVSGVSPSISGSDAANFTILAGSTCGATLGASTTCEYHIEFAPDRLGAYAASLTIEAGRGGAGAALVGNGI